ncbi:MAG: hypothetical protein ACOYKZ_06110 [Chlamydiia bacterium]
MADGVVDRVQIQPVATVRCRQADDRSGCWISAALRSCEERARRLDLGDAHGKEYGRAMHYRFQEDVEGWRIFATVGVEKTPTVTSEKLGAIGIDLNADHVAVTELDQDLYP